MKTNRKMHNYYNYIKKIVTYLMKTWKNKLAAMFIVAVGIIQYSIEKDITFLVFILPFAFPLCLISEDIFKIDWASNGSFFFLFAKITRHIMKEI